MSPDESEGRKFESSHVQDRNYRRTWGARPRLENAPCSSLQRLRVRTDAELRSVSIRIVAKCGTSLLTKPGVGVDESYIRALTATVAELMRDGIQPVMVISGAVAMGRTILGGDESNSTVSRQVLAAVGQSPLMSVFEDAFKSLGITVAQTLLSRAALEDRRGYLNARNTLLALLDRGIVPVANENDVVATEELHFGDNDALSALVANLVDADLLVMMTDVEGYMRPDDDGAMKLVSVTDRITDEMMSAAGGASSSAGTGGMKTKLEAAGLATAHGATAAIVDGRDPKNLLRLVRGERVGTTVSASGSRRESRKRWMLTDLALRGRVRIDEGAVDALAKNGRSLLPAGVMGVEGQFDRGDLVAVVGPDNSVIAHGLTNYGVEDLSRVMQHDSSAIADILGYEYGQEVVHRNNLVLMPSIQHDVAD